MVALEPAMGYSLIALNRTALNELPLQKGLNDILKVLIGGGGDESTEEVLIFCARDVNPDFGICLILATISMAVWNGTIQCTIESGSSSNVSVDGTRLERGQGSELREGCIIDIDGLKLIVVESNYLVKQVQLPILQQAMPDSEVTMCSPSTIKVCCTLSGTCSGAMQVEDGKNRGLRGEEVADVKDVEFSENQVDEGARVAKSVMLAKCSIPPHLKDASRGAMQAEDKKTEGLKGEVGDKKTKGSKGEEVVEVAELEFSKKQFGEGAGVANMIEVQRLSCHSKEVEGEGASKLVWEDIREQNSAVEDDDHGTSEVGSGIANVKSGEMKSGGAGIDVLQLAGFPFRENSTVEHRSYTEGYCAGWFLAKILEVKVEGRAVSSLTPETADDWRQHVQCYLTFPDFPDEPSSWENLFPQPNPSTQECPCSIRPLPPPQMTKKAYDSIEDKNTCQYPMVVRRTSWEVGDAVEWLWEDVWWWGHISYISADKMEVQFPGAPLGNGEGETWIVGSEELRASVLWENGTWKVASLVEMPAGLPAQSGKEPLATILWAPPISNESTIRSQSTGIGRSESLASATSWSCDTNSQKLNQSAKQGSQNILPESGHGGYRAADGPVKKRSLAQLFTEAKGAKGARSANENVNIVHPSIPKEKSRTLTSTQSLSAKKLGKAATAKGDHSFKLGHLKRQGDPIVCNSKSEAVVRKKHKITTESRVEIAPVRRCSFESFVKVAKTRVNSSPELGHRPNEGNSKSEDETRKEHEIMSAKMRKEHEIMSAKMRKEHEIMSAKTRKEHEIMSAKTLLPTGSSKKLNKASTPEGNPSSKRGNFESEGAVIDCDRASEGAVAKKKNIIGNHGSYETIHGSRTINIEKLLDRLEVIFELGNIPNSSRVAYAIDLMARSLAQAWNTRTEKLKRYVKFDDWEIFKKEISSIVGIKPQKNIGAKSENPLGGSRLRGKVGLEEMKMSLREVQRSMHLLSLDRELQDMFSSNLDKQLQEITSLLGKQKGSLLGKQKGSLLGKQKGSLLGKHKGRSKAQLMKETAAPLSRCTKHCIVSEYHNLFV